MTNISDLTPGQGSVNVEVTVKSIEEPRTFNKYGKDLRVANAVVTDDSGEIKLTLWNEDIDKVSPGIKIKITNGYVSEFQGEKQLTTGKFGKMEVLEGNTESSEQTEEKQNDKQETQEEKPKKSSSEEPEEKPEEDF